MTATDATSTPTTPSPRLQEFQSEVDELKVTGGKANPERVWVILSTIGMVVGVVLALVGWILTQGTTSTLDFASYNAMGNFGIALTFASAAVFTVMSLRRYFRFWLVRLIFELREQTDGITGSR
ncbi:MAG: hypothetical protein MUE36_01880 [Acidimicrobiales bacterium]|nr:hypothetical protein [Acidimicrobiales bacterium]